MRSGVGVELAGMTRYQVIEWMNMADGVRRMMEQDPSGEEVAAVAAALGRNITDNTGLTDIPTFRRRMTDE